jgi:hypothetical protein
VNRIFTLRVTRWPFLVSVRFGLSLCLSIPSSPHTTLSCLISHLMRSHTDDDDPLAAALRPPPDESPEARAIRITREEEARRVSQAIDESIRTERQTNKKFKIVRVLLLGQSESGVYLFLSRLSPATAYPAPRQVYNTAP